LLNIQAAAYGSTVTSVHYSTNNKVPASRYNVSYNTSNASTVISYTLQDARRVNMNIYDLKGRQIASVVNETVPAGRHKAVWNTNRTSAGAYICKTDIDGLEGWSEKFVVGK